jgi:vesicular inhibitory amino acid transporter
MSALFPNAGVSINGFEMTALQVFTLLAALIILPTVWIRDLSLLSYVSGKYPSLA